MIIWSGCIQVARSEFIDAQITNPDFAAIVAGFKDPTTFQPAEKKDELYLFIPAEFGSGTRSRRIAQNVLRVHSLVVDVDRGTAADHALMLARVRAYGYVTYTSFSHDPNGQHKFRVVVKLSRPVEITEWAAFWPRAIHALAFDTLADGKPIADFKCRDACHMYFIPGGDFSKYHAEGEDGAALSVDDVLRMDLPAGLEEATQEHFTEVLDEENRGEISPALREYAEAKLSNLSDEICKRPFPGEIYDLKVHAVYGLARYAPHIISPERIFGVVRGALDYRYRNADEYERQKYREKSLEQVQKAIADGMEKPWYPPQVDAVFVRPFTELGLAERFLDRHVKNVRYEPSWDAWVVWNGKYWDREAGDMIVQRFMKETVRSIPSEADAHYAELLNAKELFEQTQGDINVSEIARAKAEHDYEMKKALIDEIHKFAIKCETYSKISAALRLARDDTRILIHVDMLDTDPWLLNFKNGTVDLRTGAFREHRQADLITHMCPHEYDAAAECPRFERFVSDCMQDNDRMVSFLWRSIGYTLCGVTDEQKVWLLHGDGANGKSTFISVIANLLGISPTGYAAIANSENLLASKSGDSHATWRMSLFGKRFVGVQEVDEGKAFSEARIKEFSGSDVITGRKMHQDEWSYIPRFTMWLAVNHLPHVRGTDEGIWRRLCVSKWEADFRDKRDPDLARKLQFEAPGIFAKAVREARAWYREGAISLPREVVLASGQYRRDEDPLNDFIEKWCVLGSTEQSPKTEMWAAYEEYCTETKGSRTWHERKRFYAALGKRFHEKAVRGLRMFVGLRVKTTQERMESSPRAILSRAQKQRDEKPN